MDTFVGNQELLHTSYNGDGDDFFKKHAKNIPKKDIKYIDDTQITYYENGDIVNIQKIECVNTVDDFIDDVVDDVVDDIVNNDDDIDEKIKMYILNMKNDIKKNKVKIKNVNDEFNNIVENYEIDESDNDSENNIDKKLTFKF